MSSHDLAVAILVGGQSRRMGATKALLPIGPDGPTAVEAVLQAVRAVASEVVLVGSDTSAYAFLGLPHVPDTVPHAGPLAGIHAALATTAIPHLLLVACDMPFLNVRLLRYMASLPRRYDALVPVIGQPQPLHAIYARTCLPHIEASLQAGQYKLTGWFDRASVRSIAESTVARYDPSLRSSFNMNTPADLAQARQWWAATRATTPERLNLPTR